MVSNRVVTYVDINLNSVEAYWGELVVPNAKQFQSEPSPRSLFNVASSVWHLSDWVWHDRNPGQDSRGMAWIAFRNQMLAACPQLGWLGDIADAGKHRGLGRLPEVKGAGPQFVLNTAMFLAGVPSHDQKYFLILNDGSKAAVDEILREAIEFWLTELKNKALPSPYL
jgi:hypothetical protein